MRPAYLFVAALAWSTTACTSSSSPEGPIPSDDTPPLAIADFPTALTAAVCQRLVRCGSYDSAAACVLADPGWSPWERAQLVADVDAGTVEYSGSKAADCVAKISAAACGDLSIAPSAQAMYACDLFERGALPNGTDCNHDEECASSSCSIEIPPSGSIAGSCLAGTCQPVSLSEGTTCGQGNPACPSPLSCKGGICTRSQPLGAACVQPADCDVGLVCGGSSTCEPMPTLGQDCTYSQECADLSMSCVPTGGGKDFETSTCLANVELGEACSRAQLGEPGPPGYCRGGLGCDLDLTVCIELPTVGIPCPSEVCMPGSQCEAIGGGSGTCVAVTDDASVCAD